MRGAFLTLCAIAIGAVPALAQTRSATPPVMPEKADVVGDIQILKLRERVYMMVGPTGVNSVVQTGDEGVLVVDTMNTASAQSLINAIRRVSDRPILQIVNTHYDTDHVGGNEAVRKAGNYFSTANTRDEGGAAILGFENTMNRMSADGSPFANAKSAWPTDTFFVKQKDLFMNGEPVQVLHQPSAHSDSDVLVLFRKSDVLVTGDVFTPDRFPVIEDGGSIDGLIAGLNRILEIAVPEFNEEGGTLVIPGHGRICDESDVSDYRDMVTIVRDRVKDMIAKKATLEQVKAAKLTLDYDGIFSRPDYTGDMFIEAVYRSLAPAPAPAAQAPARGRR